MLFGSQYVVVTVIEEYGYAQKEEKKKYAKGNVLRKRRGCKSWIRT